MPLALMVMRKAILGLKIFKSTNALVWYYQNISGKIQWKEITPHGREKSLDDPPYYPSKKKDHKRSRLALIDIYSG